MSNYYEDVYLKRLNRYGYDYQTRVQSQRERDFENKLLRSVYRVDFDYDGESHPATLEKYKQDETQLMQYLLTRVNLNLPNGTILMIPDKDLNPQPWMVFWMESIKASGYNRYIVLKMTHQITWRDRNKNDHTTWCYFHGSGDSALKETLKGAGAIYVEDSNNRFVVMPTNEDLRKDDYMEIGEGKFAMVKVHAGTSRRGMTPVSGLTPGQKIVVKGGYELKYIIPGDGDKKKAGHFHADGVFHEGEH